MNSGKSGGYIGSDLDIEDLIKKGMDLNIQNSDKQNNNHQEKTGEDKVAVDDKIKENPNLQQLFGIKIDDAKKDESLEKLQEDKIINTKSSINEDILDEKQEKNKNAVQEVSSDDKDIQQIQEINQTAVLNEDMAQEDKYQDINDKKEKNLSIETETEKVSTLAIDEIEDMDKNQNISKDTENIENTIQDIEKKAEPVKSLSQLIEKGQTILNLSPEERKPYKYQQESQKEDKTSIAEVEIKTDTNQEKIIDTPIFTKIEEDLNQEEIIKAENEKDTLNQSKDNIAKEMKDDIKADYKDISFEVENSKIFEKNQKSTDETQEKQNVQIPKVKTAMEMENPAVVNIEKKSNDIRKKRVVKPDTKAINDLLSQNNLKTMKAVSANSYISYTKTHNKNVKNDFKNEIEVEKIENTSISNISTEKADRANIDLAKENDKNININLEKSESQTQNIDSLKENAKSEKLEKIENTQKIEKVQKFEKTENITNIEKLDNNTNIESTQKIEKLDNTDNPSGKKVDMQEVEKSVNQEFDMMNNNSNSNIQDTQRFSGRFQNIEQTQKVPLIKSIREKNQKISSDYTLNSYDSTNYNSFRNDNYNTSGVKSTIPSYPPKNNGKKIEQKAMYAGFWIRVLAFLIDYLLVAGITNIVSYFNPFELNPILESFLFVIILVVYNFISVYSTNGYTIGKLFTNIKVVSEKSDNIGFLTALTREVIGKFIIVKTFILPFFLVFSDKKHHLIDYLSDTSVIRQKYQDMYEELKAKGQL